jgi:hypothetical protein
MITITGLSRKQRAMADMVWHMTSAELESFITSLHPKDSRDARLVVELMMWAALDEEMNTDLAQAQLDKFRL